MEKEYERAIGNPELLRLLQNKGKGNRGWKRWGPYVSERQWGTVREDYSEHGNAWGYITHDMARSKAYRWGEEGIAGISDNKQTLCFSLAMWNGQDPILKERLFGLSNIEGNHGEDVKECYYYLDNTPTHSYMKYLYKYPQQTFPYGELVTRAHESTKEDPEFELADTGVFDDNRYFDVFIEYTKVDERDIIATITAVNRADRAAELHLLPTLWFRNTWEWGYESCYPALIGNLEHNRVQVLHDELADYFFFYQQGGVPLFCDNETNHEALYGEEKLYRFCKDGINEYVINGTESAVNPKQVGTKMAVWYNKVVQPGEEFVVKIRIADEKLEDSFANTSVYTNRRKKEADAFYADLQKNVNDDELKKVQRQAWAGMLWSKMFYHYNVNEWLNGDPNTHDPPESRKHGRNSQWKHLVNRNILSIPDKWEYPWYAAWDLAFHCVPLAKLDPEFAKRQLTLMLREYYMHPNGQIPAYEWNFSDVNPPVHAWGALKIYEIEKEATGEGDLDFLERIFHKLLMNFTWWVNRKDQSGNNLFEGGFLGLDNIGVFDRSHGLPKNGSLEQADGTAWMAMYALNMMKIALEVSKTKASYQEMANKFFEHFMAIAEAMFYHVGEGDQRIDLWDDEDQFYYDAVITPEVPAHLLKVRSIVGIIPLFAVEILNPGLINRAPDFTRRLQWVIDNRPQQSSLISRWYERGRGERRMLSLVRVHRLRCILKRMFDEDEFLSPYGIRALSKYHEEHPYEYEVSEHEITSISYLPGESDSDMFGGNSNWRGPVWFPINFMIIESLRKYYAYYGDNLLIEYPTHSGNHFTLDIIADKLSERLMKLFLPNEEGCRPMYRQYSRFSKDPYFKDHLLFYEYFHGDNGKGLGASHQTGWTGLISILIDQTFKPDNEL
jgi:glycogen debranching enzyme